MVQESEKIDRCFLLLKMWKKIFPGYQNNFNYDFRIRQVKLYKKKGEYNDLCVLSKSLKILQLLFEDWIPN